MATAVAALTVIGLIDETIFPGEQRTFEVAAVGERALQALAAAGEGAGGEAVVAVTVASLVELPTLVSGRWATLCEVVGLEAERVELRGVKRVQIAEARGRVAPFEVRLGDAAQPSQTTLPHEAVRGDARAAAQVLLALAEGAAPERVDWAGPVEQACWAVVRACLAPELHGRALQESARANLEALFERIGQQRQVREAARAIEERLGELAARPQLDSAARHRIWAQVVEIQRRLDVYDPRLDQESGDDLTELQKRFAQAGLPPAARDAARRQLRLLREMKKTHHDYTVHLGHLQLMARLPWHPPVLPEPDLGAVRDALDREHVGLSRPKRRILEYLAVRSLGGSTSSTVLCLAGPPGVGKTTLARAIAEALGRPFVRVALGGVHEESELRGHRLSYVAAAPGRIIDGIARAGSMAPVMLLDEIDKISTARHRSPAAALLEVLDPEQNTHFRDNYLGTPYDLSHVLFLATANDIAEIPEALRDRLEIIELEGYSVHEKIAMAREHMLPRQARDHGVGEVLELDDALLRRLIEGYTREAGVRELQRTLAALYRDRALRQVLGEPDGEAEAGGGEPGEDKVAPVDEATVLRVLGPAPYTVRDRREALPCGVATGLSVSGRGGGALLFVEVGRMPSAAGGAAPRGELRMTGRAGEVFREAAHTALSWLRINAGRLGLEAEQVAGDFHVHLPEAAVPKDGPSAGIALVAAFVSACRDRPLRADVAMTGEVTLTGEVLAVGGVRAKLLAAERAGIRRVVVPEANRADIPEELTIETITVRHVEQVLEAVFSPDEVPPCP